MSAPLKVLFISPTVACYIGGTETVVSQLAERIKGRAELTVLSAVPEDGARLLIDAAGFELITLPFLGRDSRGNRLLSKLLMTSRFKIESFSFFRSLARSGVDLARFDVIATFYEADAYLLEKRYPALRERFRHLLPGVSMRRFFKRVPARDVFFFGYRAAPRAERKWGVKVQSLPLGVDERFFPAAAPAWPEERRLVFVGRLDKSKHADWLAQFFAASGLAQQGYRLDIIGDGPLLESLRAAHGPDSGIRLHGRKRQEEVIGLLHGAFLLLHPTDLESFGLTILEGMAAGVPVITHELDSVKVWAGNHPRYAAHLDEAAWLAEIRRFEERDYWERVSAEGMAFARGLTWAGIAEQVLGILRRGRG
ncbi:glycosyltransferase family 4 protein [Noviherbaspirillum aerium]|uniref:glycosyltransferase family 4 protein n=1 Tax=Noviherbaspirillum aerium TaxID=2588497 RepID=UPI00178C176D|nr:glycosyltransferase family 4 protein [Noviherbaspirillum aerium]